MKQHAYINASIGNPVNTNPKLSTGSPSNLEGPKNAKAIVDTKKQTTN